MATHIGKEKDFEWSNGPPSRADLTQMTPPRMERRKRAFESSLEPDDGRTSLSSFFCILTLLLRSTMDGAGDAAASASGFDAEAVVCAACSQSSGPFSKRQLKKAQAGEPARKFSSPRYLMCLDHAAFTLLCFSSAHTYSLAFILHVRSHIFLINTFQLSSFRMHKMRGERYAHQIQVHQAIRCC